MQICTCTTDLYRDDRHVLSSERAHYIHKTAMSHSKKILSSARDVVWHQDWLADWPSTVTWLWFRSRWGVIPCEVGFEYLHCSPANRKRRPDGNPDHRVPQFLGNIYTEAWSSSFRESQIWEMVVCPAGLGPKMTVLARVSSNLPDRGQPTVH
jgi:hypothetical protein